MLKLALLQLRTHYRRTLAIVIAILLGVAFFSASMMSGTVIKNAIRAEVGIQLRGADLIAMADSSPVDSTLIGLARQVDGVEAVEPVQSAYGTIATGGTSTVMQLGPVSELPEIVDQLPLSEGRLPKAGDEITLTEGAASSLGIDLDDTLSWTPFGAGEPSTEQYRVVGLVSGGNTFGTNLTEAFVASQAFNASVAEPNLNALIIQVADDSILEGVQDSVSDALPDDINVLTFDQMVDAEVASLEQGSNALTYGLVAFALISLFVAGIVISNTFSITLTQRTHELAMLRCIGAEKRQVYRSVIHEAAVLGFASSIAGLLAGFAIVNAGARLFLERAGGLSLSDIPSWMLVLPIVVGMVVTILAAVLPARNATSVHPLQALRHTDAPVEQASGSVLRIVIASVMVAGGGAMMIGGMSLSLSMEGDAPFGPLLLGMAGGALSFAGLLVASTFIIPLGIRMLGTMTGAVLGVPSRIASSNAMRNPGRTAATSSALMMGVALITMMTVGAATVKATWNDVIDQQAPIDLSIQQSREESDTPMSQAIYGEFRDVDGVRKVVSIHAQPVRMTSGDQGLDITAVGIDPQDSADVVRSDAISDDFRDGLVLVPVDLANNYRIDTGDSVTLEQEGQAIELTARTVELPDGKVYITLDDASQLTDDLPVTGAWIRLQDDADVKDVVQDISDGIPDGENVSIHGGASDRASYIELVDQMLLITTGLLGVAVIIAIVGVGNTLTLSVLERTRESGMLRAMGLTVRQLRATLAIEGVMIAFVGGVIGIVAGTVYGWIGAITLFGSSWEVTPGFPGMRLLHILMIAILAGLLASVLPGRRASSIAPVEALAAV